MMARTLNAEQIVTNQGSANDDSLEKIEPNETEANTDGFWETDSEETESASEDYLQLEKRSDAGKDIDENSGSSSDDLPAIVSTIEKGPTAETATTQDSPIVEGIESSETIEETVSETATQEIIWDEAVERAKDEKEFFEKLKEARHELKLAESEWDAAKSNAKIAKEEYTLAQAVLYQIAEEGVVYRQKPKPKPIAVMKPVDAIVVSNPISPDAQKEDWKKIETSTILAGIEGLGAKKRQSLIDAFPTFGKLMDARTESSKEFVPFHSLLPKGIGESIGTEIINRMDKAIVPGM